jgi:hypothetical protein
MTMGPGMIGKLVHGVVNTVGPLGMIPKQQRQEGKDLEVSKTLSRIGDREMAMGYRPDAIDPHAQMLHSTNLAWSPMAGETTSGPQMGGASPGGAPTYEQAPAPQAGPTQARSDAQAAELADMSGGGFWADHDKYGYGQQGPTAMNLAHQPTMGEGNAPQSNITMSKGAAGGEGPRADYKQPVTYQGDWRDNFFANMKQTPPQESVAAILARMVGRN